MKTKIFAYEVRRGLWVLATARIINKKCLVSFCYAESHDEVTPDHLPNIVDIQNWCITNDSVLWSY